MNANLMLICRFLLLNDSWRLVLIAAVLSVCSFVGSNGFCCMNSNVILSQISIFMAGAMAVISLSAGDSVTKALVSVVQLIGPPAKQKQYPKVDLYSGVALYESSGQDFKQLSLLLETYLIDFSAMPLRYWKICSKQLNTLSDGFS